MTRRAVRRTLALLALGLLAPAAARAQVPTDTTRRDSTRTADSSRTNTMGDTTKRVEPDTLIPPPPPPPPPPAPALPFTFSGVLFTNYSYGGARINGSRAQNGFNVERAYLTFNAPAGDRVSIRITGDVFQKGDTSASTYYRGWTFRAKYAYGQYDFIRGLEGELKANVRLGMLHTPIVDYEEHFWPRGLAQVGVERAGFFSSSDLGGAVTVTLPNKFGEIYATVLNGGGYTALETDRFKDVGGRLSITPFGNTHSLARTFTITPWYYKGERASRFARQTGTVAPVTAGQQKDRWGFFTGINDPRITLAGQLAWSKNATESADTLVDVTPAFGTQTGRVISAYTIVRPLTFFNTLPSWPVSAVFRWDQFRPNTANDADQRFLVAGLGWELTKKAAVYADYQEQTPKNGLTGSAGADLKTYFLHAIINF